MPRIDMLSSEKFHTLSRWATRIITVIAGLGILSLCLLLGGFVLIEGASAQMAYALRPPEYSGSQLTEQWQSGGTDTRWDRRTYYTTDDVEQVLAFYEERMPGFYQPDAIKGGARYVNGKCDESQLARYVARLINEGHYPWYTADNVPLPCVSISIYPAMNNQTGTQFEIWVTWPAN